MSTSGLIHDERFSTWDAFVDAAASHVDGASNGADDGHHGLEAGFFGTPDLAAACALARSGWLEGWKPAAAWLAGTVPTVAAAITRPDLVYDVEGDGIDVGRYCAGEPECWSRWEESPMLTHAVPLLVNVAARASVPPAHYHRRGAVLLALVECLEFAGVRCEITVTGHRVWDGKRARTDVRVKDAGQPVDPGRLAFALTHPSMNRRLMWSLYERAGLDKRMSPNKGAGIAVPEREHAPGTVYVPDLPDCPHWESDTAARTYLVATLAAQGVTLRDRS